MSEKPVGVALPDWQAPPRPNPDPLDGRYARLERLCAETHVGDLYRANMDQPERGIWTYLPYGPFTSQASYYKWVREMAGMDDPWFWAVKDKETGRFCGVASYLRIKPESGSIEVGHINFAPSLQRTRAGTEAMYLMMKWAFEAGYRRYEWKCNALNRLSRVAAQRLGFSYEGVFRQATISKGRNRDTAWFAAIDQEWPALKVAFEAWLAPSNFDANGQQIERLADLTALVRVASDPSLEG